MKHIVIPINVVSSTVHAYCSGRGERGMHVERNEATQWTCAHSAHTTLLLFFLQCTLDNVSQIIPACVCVCPFLACVRELLPMATMQQFNTIRIYYG